MMRRPACPWTSGLSYRSANPARCCRCGPKRRGRCCHRHGPAGPWPPHSYPHGEIALLHCPAHCVPVRPIVVLACPDLPTRGLAALAHVRGALADRVDLVQRGLNARPQPGAAFREINQRGAYLLRTRSRFKIELDRTHDAVHVSSILLTLPPAHSPITFSAPRRISRPTAEISATPLPPGLCPVRNPWMVEHACPGCSAAVGTV